MKLIEQVVVPQNDSRKGIAAGQATRDVMAII